MAEFNVGLVGLGEISSYFINAVQKHPRMKMVAVCRRRPQEDDKEKYKDYKFYTDWKELVEDPEVNCIIIATPPSTHAPITKHALEDALDCIALAKDTHTHLNFAYHAAMNPLSVLAKSRVEEFLSKGEKIDTVKVVYKEHVQNYHDGQSWIFNPAISGGGVLIDSGVNAISVVQHICGKVEPTTVELGYGGSFSVEASAKVGFVGITHPELKGELVQDWIWPGEEQREITVTFQSGVVISFCFAKGSLTTVVDGNPVTEQVINKEATDVHLTPMSLEYINVINFAVEGFDKEVVVDELGEGPFAFVMKCYEKANVQYH